MSICINKGDHLWIEVSEPYSLKHLLSTIRDVANHCEQDKLDKVLIDLRKMEGNPSIFDRFQLGLEIVKAWGSKLKVAVIARPGVITRMAENTAVNRGVRLLSTTDLETALKWLDVDSQVEQIGE